MDKFIEEDAEEHSSGSDDDSTKDINDIGDAVPIDSLKIEQDHHDEADHVLASRNSDRSRTLSEEGTSCRSENGLKNPPSAVNGDAVEPLESGSSMPSQDGDNDESDDDSDDKDDAALTRQLNTQRKKAIAAVRGRRRPVSSRNAYKDKGKGTMSSKIQRQACKW